MIADEHYRFPQRERRGEAASSCLHDFGTRTRRSLVRSSFAACALDDKNVSVAEKDNNGGVYVDFVHPLSFRGRFCRAATVTYWSNIAESVARDACWRSHGRICPISSIRHDQRPLHSTPAFPSPAFLQYIPRPLFSRGKCAVD